MAAPTKELKGINSWQGINGWLFLLAIGLLISPIFNLITLKDEFLPIFQKGYWKVLTTPGSGAYHQLWAPIIISNIFFITVFIVCNLFLIYLFFSKYYRFPKYFIVFLLSEVFYAVANFYFMNQIPTVAAQSNLDLLRDVIRAIFNAVVWVPYCLVSKRVKNTFVKHDFNSELSSIVGLRAVNASSLSVLRGGQLKSKWDLIKNLAKKRIQQDTLVSAMGFNESMVDSLSEMQLAGIPEGTVATIVETYALLKQKGFSDGDIFRQIEAHRSMIVSGKMPAPLNLETYTQYRVALENEMKTPISEKFISEAVQIAREHFGC